MIVERQQKLINVYLVKCDTCKDGYCHFDSKHNIYSMWFTDKEEALHEALTDGWIEDFGMHYCPECYGKIMAKLERAKKQY